MDSLDFSLDFGDLLVDDAPPSSKVGGSRCGGGGAGPAGIKPPMSVRPGAAAQVCAYDELADPNSDCSAEVRRANTHYRPPFSSFFLHPTTLSLSLYSPPPLLVGYRTGSPSSIRRARPTAPPAAPPTLACLSYLLYPSRGGVWARRARVRSRGGSARWRSAACSLTCRC